MAETVDDQRQPKMNSEIELEAQVEVGEDWAPVRSGQNSDWCRVLMAFSSVGKAGELGHRRGPGTWT